MKQKTAITRALKNRYDLKSVRFNDNGIITGAYANSARAIDRITIGHIDDMWTADHNGHSTRVYKRHIFIGTVYGSVDT